MFLSYYVDYYFYSFSPFILHAFLVIFRAIKREAYMVETGITMSFQVLSLIAIIMDDDTIEMIITHTKRANWIF